MTILSTEKISFFYGNKKAIENIQIKIPENKITAIIGPSGCGKSTLLRSFNRMNELIHDTTHEGSILFKGKNIFDPGVDIVNLRKKIGMVFQKPNPFPKSIFENIVYGPRLNGIKDENTLINLVEKLLKRVALWDEVKDKIHESAFALSGGQQQRLCIARALAVEPEILLMDEPCSALDPIATLKIEDLMRELAKDITIVIVTHNMQQAARVSDLTAFLMVEN